METFLKILLSLLVTLWAALVGWWFFPDAVLDLGYWDWFKVAIVGDAIVSSAIASHELWKD